MPDTEHGHRMLCKSREILFEEELNGK